MQGYDPFQLGEATRKSVVRVVGGVEERKYYRFRGGRWYGGIATGDVVGCNLRCKFCWSWRFTHITDKGYFRRPEEAFEKIFAIASRKGYKYVRVSGGEPTLSLNHLQELLKLFSETKYVFILETNGLLIGKEYSLAKMLSNYSNVVVRVSFKGATEEEFNMLTGAKPEFFNYQFKALENLIEVGFKPGEEVYPAIMLSFSTDENYAKFKKRLMEINPRLVESIDEEYVILYPHVIELLKKNKLRPRLAFTPDNIPQCMI
ncbi:radical SAM protein [Ignisphaera sp. 4213-co]|uniref:Radical SAM protein n=1 Tax=Ignisphaera cupida TaxID=3050454 RepID=A0ABD4Z7U3_9CREN|nr:radical SAM protein [Ignisphaera sp. 4213-co]MDK6028638.1 radical SAM protein [Ignisphaera sp. 4213-co]